MRTAAYLLLVNGLALAATLVAAEIILGSLHPSHNRYLFFSEDALAYDEKFDVVHYKSNASLRTYASYQKVVEYDTTFNTNNFGYIDTQDYRQGAPSVAIIGDSFAAGDGGRPWVPNLRPLFSQQNLQLLSLGVTGTGLDEFTDKLRWASAKFDLRYAVILFIKGDRARPDWRPLERGSFIYFCLPRESDEACVRRRPIIHTDPASDLTTFHANELPFLKRSAFRMFPNLYSAVSDIKRRLIDKATARPSADLHYSLFLSVLGEEFGDIPVVLIQIPEKEEVLEQKFVTFRDYNYPANVQYIALDECLFDISLYHRIDSHLSQRGYERLEMCLREALIERCVHCTLSRSDRGS